MPTQTQRLTRAALRAPNVIRTVQLAIVAALVTITSIATASDGRITYLEAVGSSDRPMMLAASDRGVGYIGADAQLFRTFKHSQQAPPGVDQPFLWVVDIDGDGRKEVVGAGLPSFVINDNADPIWGVLNGCDQYFVGDFVDDRSLEFLCIRGNSMRIWSHHGQEYFNWTGTGYTITACYGDDFDSDRRMEVACNLSNGNHLFFDIAEWYNDPNYEPLRDGPAPEALHRGGVDRAPQAAIAAGDEPLEVGGRSVQLGFAGGALSLTVDGTSAGEVHIGGSGIYSAAAADLDGDGVHELYVGGDAVVHIVRLDATLVGTVPVNPDATRRDARVTVRSATANGLEDSDRDSVRAVVEAGTSALVDCYNRRMGADQFTRVGQMLFELSVNSSGRVTAANRRHSGLSSPELETCISGALQGLRFSPATDPSAVVAVTLDFTFVDLPGN